MQIKEVIEVAKTFMEDAIEFAEDCVCDIFDGVGTFFDKYF